MDLIQMTRELAKEIQKDERYTAYLTAKINNDSDVELQDLIGEFNLQRINLNTELNQKEKNETKINEINTAVQKTYQEIMENPNMIAFSEAKQEVDLLMRQINTILTKTINGENPEAIDLSACTGSCDSCGGCN